MTLLEGIHSVCRPEMVVNDDCLPGVDAAANQYGIEAESVGTAYVCCKLITDHYHISGAAASQCLLKDGGMGLAEPIELQMTLSGITLVQRRFEDQGDSAAGYAEIQI